VDSIEEAAIQTGKFSAEFGQAADTRRRTSHQCLNRSSVFA
jgi:hypothetical protein